MFYKQIDITTLCSGLSKIRAYVVLLWKAEWSFVTDMEDPENQKM